MMTHVEGPIVDSLYDTLLYSWHVPFEPSLPRMHNPTSTLKYSSFNDESFKKLFNEDGTLIHEASLEMPNGEVSARLPPHDPSAPHYDESIAGEFIRMRSTLVARSPDTHISLVNQHLNRATNANRPATVPEPSSVTDYFSPYIPHPPHRPFPVALVNRKPAGAPNNASLHVPQNAAWISGLRNAKKNVFIQTPNLNAKALLPEMIKAVKRGVEVEFWVCLGYNDAGEMLPAQGGQNDLISKKLVDELKGESEEIRKLLKAGWYVAKDQDKPIHKMEQGRCCHGEYCTYAFWTTWLILHPVKIMIVDDQVGIQGSGNQDTQSWYHSQEVNIMIDSKMICESWRDALHRNQSEYMAHQCIAGI
jgi:phosphatidylserine/phosphatidylglycerophosphate/cardiolipin synthase-like enzyme